MFVKMQTDLMEGWLENLVAVPYGIWIAWVGVQHFRDPAWFEPIVPGILGNARFWVLASGAFEILLGLGVALPWFRREAAFGITLMLLVLYWANLNMWVNDISIGETNFSTLQHMFRAAAQIAMIWLSLWIAEWPVKKEL